MAKPAPRLLVALSVLAVALCTSAHAAARSCIGHAYERMKLELGAVYRGDAEVPRPPELKTLDELLNSGGQGKSVLLWEQATLGFGKFYRLEEEKAPTPKVGRYLSAVSQRKLMTSCGYSVAYTPVLPGRYVFDQEHLGGEKTSAGIDDPVVVVAPGRDKVELRFSLKGLRYRAVYRVTCASFDWQPRDQRCAESEPSEIDVPVEADAPAPPAEAAPQPAPAPAPPAPGEAAPQPAPAPAAAPPPRGCGGCAAAEGAGPRPVSLLAAALVALLTARRRPPRPPIPVVPVRRSRAQQENPAVPTISGRSAVADVVRVCRSLAAARRRRGARRAEARRGGAGRAPGGGEPAAARDAPGALDPAHPDHRSGDGDAAHRDNGREARRAGARDRAERRGRRPGRDRIGCSTSPV